MKPITKAVAAISSLTFAASVGFMAAGPASQADTAGWERISNVTTVDNGSGVEVVEAECSSGSKKAVGGGWSVGDSDLGNAPVVVEDQPFSAGGGWSVHFTRESVDREVAVYVICINQT
jgi:hypothetical protein